MSRGKKAPKGCPCGLYNYATGRRAWTCSPQQIARYLAKIRVRTTADLAGTERIGSGHVAAAAQYRALDRAYFQGG